MVERFWRRVLTISSLYRAAAIQDLKTTQSFGWRLKLIALCLAWLGLFRLRGRFAHKTKLRRFVSPIRPNPSRCCHCSRRSNGRRSKTTIFKWRLFKHVHKWPTPRWRAARLAILPASAGFDQRDAARIAVARRLVRQRRNYLFAAGAAGVRTFAICATRKSASPVWAALPTWRCKSRWGGA